MNLRLSIRRLSDGSWAAFKGHRYYRDTVRPTEREAPAVLNAISHEVNTVNIFGREILADSNGEAFRYSTRKAAEDRIKWLPGHWQVFASAIPGNFFIERNQSTGV